MKVTHIKDHVQWERHRFEEDDGEIYYQLQLANRDMPEREDEFVYVHGPNAKQISFKILDILNNRTRI